MRAGKGACACWMLITTTGRLVGTEWQDAESEGDQNRRTLVRLAILWVTKESATGMFTGGVAAEKGDAVLS
jgi:hypothetical protein